MLQLYETKMTICVRVRERNTGIRRAKRKKKEKKMMRERVGGTLYSLPQCLHSDVGMDT